MSTATQLLSTLGSGPRELAKLASLAGRVEPQLLRALRLELAPHLIVADEADLWFSPIVETAAATGLVFRVEVLSDLQLALAEDPTLLENVWELLFRMRTGVRYFERERATRLTWLVIQEELSYWSLRTAPKGFSDRERIRTLWAWVENTVHDKDDRMASDANSWIESARMRLPFDAWSLPGASRLLNDSALRSLRLRPFWVRLVLDGIELSDGELAGGHRIETAAEDPIRLSLVWNIADNFNNYSTHIFAGKQEQIRTEASVIDLYLLDGQAFRLATAKEDRTGDDGATRLSRAVVRIRHSNGNVVACGLQISRRYIILCSHAVSTSTTNYFDDRVQVIFPSQPSNNSPPYSVPGIVIARSPFPSAQPLSTPFGALADDLAVVQLDQELNDASDLSEELGRRYWEQDSVVGRTVRTFGYSEQSDLGAWISGIITAVTQRGFEVDFDSRIQPGWSGSPVWDEQKGLLGLVQSSEDLGEPAKQLTIVVPVRPLSEVLAAVPRRVLVVGSGEADLPENVWRPASALGVALAKAGYVLVCGGWPGVDHIVARDFASTLDGADSRLGERLEQLVETESPPDFRSGIEPLRIPADTWAQAMAQRGDAVVLIGGLGGALKVARAAEQIAVPVIPIPGSGGDAAQLYSEIAARKSEPNFPDTRALRGMEGSTASALDSEKVVANMLEVLRESLDESTRSLYWRCARSVLSLLNQHGLNLVSWNTELRQLVEQLEAADRREPKGKVGSPRVDAEAAVLASSLPSSARWLVQDYLTLESSTKVWAGAAQVQLVLLQVLLADQSARDRLEEALLLAPQYDPPELPDKLQRMQDLLRTQVKTESERIPAIAFLQRVERRAVLRSMLTQLRALAVQFLRPVASEDHMSVYRKLYDAAQSKIKAITADTAAQLVISNDTADRVIGYTFFLQLLDPDIIASFPQALTLERDEAARNKETRPLWLLLQCFRTCIDNATLRSELPSATLSVLQVLERLLDERKDIDPGRECYNLLSGIIAELDRTDDVEQSDIPFQEGTAREPKPRRTKKK